MSVEKTEIETFFGRCRCCLSYGYLKNMWEEHQFEGKAEIYGEMLVQCFALTWDHTEDSMEQDQICEQCVCRLRDASDFKRVVLDSQEELFQQVDAENELSIKEERLDEDLLIEYKHPGSEDTADITYADTEYIEYTMDTADTVPSIKDETEYEEVEYLEDEDAGGANDAVDTDSSQPRDQSRPAKRRTQPRKQDTDDEEAPKRKWPKKLPKSERHKTYKQYSELDLRKCLEEVRNNVLTTTEAALKYGIPKKTLCAKIKVDPNDAHRNKKATENENGKAKSNVQRNKAQGNKNTTRAAEDEKDNRLQKNRTRLANFKESVRSVLRYTNATPIRGYWGIGYACNYCKYQTPEISELKKHTLTTHSGNVDELDNVKYVPDMIIQLDITDLNCKICDHEIETLEDIMNHLKVIHRQPIHLDTTNHIIPFKFGKNDLSCALCAKEFNYFKHLSEHMNEHFPNYACKECNRCFINLRSLRTHTIRHQKGTFVCAFCSKIFDTRIKMKEHERVLHVRGSKNRKCGYCDERFMDAVRKTEHEVKEHGAPVRKFACKDCGKVFDSQRSVKNHINNLHLQLRPHKCPECDKGFYTKNEMKRHRVKHTKIKEFQCLVCSKYYVSRASLRGHMKIHDSEKTYTCERCGEMFIQKNVWVNHITNHAKAQALKTQKLWKSQESAENA